MLVCCLYYGGAMGSVTAGVVSVRIGLQRTLLYSQFICIFGTILQVAFGVEYFELICLGKFIQGFAKTLPWFIYGKCINETIPNHLLSKYTLFNNGFCWFGVVVAGWISMVLPDPAADWEVMRQDNYWKVVYGFKLVPQLLGVIFTLTYFKHPSLNLLIKNNQQELAIVQIKKIYALPKSE